jgi:hypothetical protein
VLSTFSISAKECRPSGEGNFANFKQIRKISLNFVKESAKIKRAQPYLYMSEFVAADNNIVSFTRKYQGYPGKIRLIRNLLTTPGMQMFYYKNTYKQVAKALSDIWSRFPENISFHVNENGDPDNQKRWIELTKRSMDGMMPDGYYPGMVFPKYQLHDCDYITQPLNALRYLLNGLFLLDQAALCRFGDSWTNYRNQVNSKFKIQGPGFYRQALENKDLIPFNEITFYEE